jgi:hypothetical protein
MVFSVGVKQKGPSGHASDYLQNNGFDTCDGGIYGWGEWVREHAHVHGLAAVHVRSGDITSGQEQHRAGIFTSTNTGTVTTRVTGHKRKTWWQLRQEYEEQQARKRPKTARAVRTGGTVRERARAGDTDWDTG